MRKAFVVQDRETKGFLSSSPDGDIVTCPWINNAFQFDNFEVAVLTGLQECELGYQIFTFFVDDDELKVRE